jgi:hypothetical protein
VAPNLMVVVPTSDDVTLNYGSSGADKVGELLTLAALAGIVAIWVGDRRTRRSRQARRSANSATDRAAT